HQVAGIPFGLLPEGILANDALPLVRSTNEEIDFQRETVGSLRLQKPLELGSRADLACENEVAALQQRATVLEPKLGDEIPQIGHADRPVTADVDAAEKGDMRCQR